MTTEKNIQIEYSQRRKRSLNRPRLMDGDEVTNPTELSKGTRVAIYVRVSSEEQVDGYSLAAQERVCREIARKRNWTVVGLYSDPGHSGKNDKRPGFQRMINHAKQQKFQAILFHKLDRFTRNAENALRYFKELNEYDVTIASATEEFDYTTPHGRLFFRMMALFAQWYLENLSSEVVKAKKEMARRGVHNGRLPFGYVKTEEGRVVQVEDEASIVRQAFELYATGEYTNQSIANFFNESGYKTRRGRNWSKDTINDFLKNEFFYGKVAYRDQLWPGRHEPIITKELFDRCAVVREEHTIRPRTHMATTKAREIHLLQRIIHCAHCERPMRVFSARPSGKRKYGYYQDASRARGLECEFSGKGVRKGRAEEMVFEQLLKLNLPEDWQSSIRQRIEDMDIVRKIEKRKAKIEDDLQRIGRAYVDGAYDENTYEARRSQLLKEKAGLKLPDGASVIEIGLKMDNLQEFLEHASEKEKYQILHAFFEAVYYDFNEKEIISFKPKPEFMGIFQVAAPSANWRITDDELFELPSVY